MVSVVTGHRQGVIDITGGSGSLLFYLRVLQQTARWRVFLKYYHQTTRTADNCRMWMRGNGLLARQTVCQRCSIPVEEHPYARLQDGVRCDEWAAGNVYVGRLVRRKME